MYMYINSLPLFELSKIGDMFLMNMIFYMNRAKPYSHAHIKTQKWHKNDILHYQ